MLLIFIKGMALVLFGLLALLMLLCFFASLFSEDAKEFFTRIIAAMLLSGVMALLITFMGS